MTLSTIFSQNNKFNSIINKKRFFTKNSILFLFVIYLTINATNLKSQTPPNLLTPIDNETCLSATPELKWDLVINAVTYAYQVSTDQNFNTIITGNLNFNRRNIILAEPLNPETVYFWRAGSIFSGNSEIKWATARKFTTAKSPPNLLTPANNITCASNTQNFTWSAVVGADSYQIQISETANFTSVVKDSSDIKVARATFVINKGFTTFYYRVRALTGSCFSDFSSTFFYQTKLASPSLTFPLTGQTGIDLNSNFTWSSATGAASYEIEISKSPTFDIIVVSANNYIPTSLIVTLTDNNVLYYLRIRSKTPECTSDWSSSIQFRTKYRPVTLNSPVNNLECIPLLNNLKWIAISGVTSYTLEVALSNNFNSPLISLPVFRIDTTIKVDNSNTNHFWRIKANDAINDGEWSEIRVFKTTISAPLPLFPLDKVENVFLSTEIRWRYLSAINGPYRIQIAYDSTFDNIVIDDANAPVDTYTKLSINFLPKYNTVYYWRVYAQLTPCVSGWSKVFSFKSVVGFPELVSPNNGSPNQTLSNTFVWKDVQTADSYNIEFSKNINFSSIESMSKTQIKATQVNILGFEENTQYNWRVRSNNKWGQSPWSPIYTFVTGIAQAGVPLLTFPTNNSIKIDLNLKLEWEKIAAATSYRVQISEKSSFSDIKIDNIVPDNEYPIVDLDNFKEYYWRISAINSTTESPFSNKFSFRTLAKNITKQTNLNTPNNNAIDLDSATVSFKWEIIPEADLSMGGRYKLIISDIEDMSNIIFENENIYNANFNLYNQLKANTKYYWRITAINEAGEGPASEIFNFMTKQNITSIFESNDFPFSIVPNPAKDLINLITNLNSNNNNSIKINDITTIEILSLEGKTLGIFDNINLSNINVSTFSKGVYLLKLNTLNNTFITKFIKE